MPDPTRSRVEETRKLHDLFHRYAPGMAPIHDPCFEAIDAAFAAAEYRGRAEATREIVAALRKRTWHPFPLVSMERAYASAAEWIESGSRLPAATGQDGGEERPYSREEHQAISDRLRARGVTGTSLLPPRPAEPEQPPPLQEEDADDECECEHARYQHEGDGGACKAKHRRAYSRCSCPSFKLACPKGRAS